METKERLLYGTSNCCDSYDYEYYKEFCEINEIEPQGEDSQDYWNWVSETQGMYFDDLMDNLKYSKANDGNYAITFTLGLWNGKHEGFVKEVKTSLSDAINECVYSTRGGYDDIKVTYEDWSVWVYGYHHDGVNIFRIQRLSKKGERALVEAIDPNFETAVENKTNFKRILEKELF